MSLELIIGIIALVAVLVSMFLFGMRMGRLENDVEMGHEETKEAVAMIKDTLDKVLEMEKRLPEK